MCKVIERDRIPSKVDPALKYHNLKAIYWQHIVFLLVFLSMFLKKWVGNIGRIFTFEYLINGSLPTLHTFPFVDNFTLSSPFPATRRYIQKGLGKLVAPCSMQMAGYYDTCNILKQAWNNTASDPGEARSSQKG